MAKKELDKETQKVMSQGQKIADFVNSDSWQLIRKKLYDKLITIDSIMEIPSNMSNEQRLQEIGIRAGAVSLILDWIKEIEGTAAQHKNNVEAFSEIRKESIVQYFG